MYSGWLTRNQRLQQRWRSLKTIQRSEVMLVDQLVSWIFKYEPLNRDNIVMLSESEGEDRGGRTPSSSWKFLGEKSVWTYSSVLNEENPRHWKCCETQHRPHPRVPHTFGIKTIFYLLSSLFLPPAAFPTPCLVTPPCAKWQGETAEIPVIDDLHLSTAFGLPYSLHRRFENRIKRNINKPIR